MTRSHHQHTNTGVPGVSFSWRRAIGLSALETRISRKTGIPMSRSGRERKIGHFVMHSFGALFWLAVAGVGYFATTHPELVKQIAAAFHIA
ncbi:MAG: hypothetical protein ABWZ40_11500 [Caulobacterales bacterium]